PRRVPRRRPGRGLPGFRLPVGVRRPLAPAAAGRGRRRRRSRVPGRRVVGAARRVEPVLDRAPGRREPPRRRGTRRDARRQRRAALAGGRHAGGTLRRTRPPLRPARHALRRARRTDATAHLPRASRRARRRAAGGLGRMTTPLLAARGLAFARNEQPVFGPLDFTVEPGEALLVQGGNGAGKTTLLRVLAGLLRADAGRVEIDGRDADPTLRARAIAFLGH